MDLEGVGAAALFRILISTCEWYFRRQINRIGYGPEIDSSKVDAPGAKQVREALSRLGGSPDPTSSEYERRLQVEGDPRYRERFSTAPIRKWHAHNQEPMLMAEYWDFRGDHTGEVVETGMMAYPERRSTFQWRELGDRTIETLVIARQECLSQDEQGHDVWAESEDVSDEEWEVLEYDFRYLEGPRPDVVMHVVGQVDFPTSKYTQTVHTASIGGRRSFEG